MSKQSKARRTVRRKGEADRPIRRLGQTLRSHAQLADADGQVFGGAGWRDGEWLLVLDGQVVARTDSAAMLLAMLRHAATVLSTPQRTVAVNASPQLQQVAANEAAVAGHTLEDHLQWLEAERATRAAGQPALH